jgi:hypothetical protein
MKNLRKKDPASSQHQFCYTGEELLQYRSEKLPPEKRSRIFDHLNVEKCERCRRLYFSVKKPDEETITPGFDPSIMKKIKKRKIAPRTCPVPLKLEKGQIWTTSLEPENIYGEIVGSVAMGIPVMIIFPGSGKMSLENIIRVIPISCDIEFQLEGESLVIDKASPLQYPILLEIFNEKPMFAGNLEEYSGSISSEDLMKVIALRKQFLDGETSKPDPEYLAWKQKEIELTGYLTFPVNESIWEEDAEIVSEKHKFRLVYASPEELKDSIAQIVPGILWPKEPASLEEVLALAQFPPEQLRLAADHTDHETFPANLVHRYEGKIKSFEPMQAEIFMKEADSSGITISGKIMKVPEGLIGSSFICFLLFKDKKMLAPERFDWDEKTGNFLAKFKAEDGIEGKLAVAVVFDYSEK